MSTKRTPVSEQEAEMARLEAIGRERALTDAESDRLAHLIYCQQLRGYRLDQLLRARRRVRMLEQRAAAA